MFLTFSVCFESLRNAEKRALVRRLQQAKLELQQAEEIEHQMQLKYENLLEEIKKEKNRDSQINLVSLT